MKRENIYCLAHVDSHLATTREARLSLSSCLKKLEQKDERGKQNKIDFSDSVEPLDKAS